MVNLGDNNKPKYKLIKNCTDKQKKNIHFSEKIKVFIENYVKLIFNKEVTSTCKRFSNTIEEFITKCVNSRNRLSHMNTDISNIYFSGTENIYAFYKLLLIFRLNLIVDLNLEKNIMQNNINLNVYYTDKWYINNCTLCNFCNQKHIKRGE